MSTASRNCGMAGGTCGREPNAHPAPGVRAWPRGYYDPRAFWQLGSGNAWPKCWPSDDNAAPPRKRAQQLAGNGRSKSRHALFKRCARLALAPYSFPIGLRERHIRHSPPPFYPRPPP